jgi:hypothetical protein
MERHDWSFSQTDCSEQRWAYQVTSRQTRSGSYDIIDEVI